MSIFKALLGITQETGLVKNARQQIFAIRDRLRNTQQFSKIFYDIVKDPGHPPMSVLGEYSSGAFWSIAWDSQANTYEPYSTLKLQDVNIGYLESCAVFLLLQECYPNVYDFPNRTSTEIANQVPVELIMKKEFIGKAVIPAVRPQEPVQSTAVPRAAEQAKPMFCSKCGERLKEGAEFCVSCGDRIL